jgi:hypothetical protein
MMPWSALMEDACRFFERHLTDEHRRHLWTRYGLEPAFVEVMRIGYAPADGSALLLHLMDRGYSRDEIIGSGLVVPWQRTDAAGVTRSGVSDLLRGRIVFPYLDADLRPVYFIGRMTDETPARDDTTPAKYKKQLVTIDGPREPICGVWSVSPGDPLIITEGITDCLAVLQTGRPCISPVTTRFKREQAPEVAELVRRSGGPVYILNDNEESGEGGKGAANIAYNLISQALDGARVFIGSPPRPEGVEKVDLNDFLRSGGDLDAVIAEAIPAEEHPGVLAEQKRVYARIAADVKQQRDRQRWIESGKKPRRGESIEDLKARMPSLSAYTGIPGGRGSHPVYGSIHGDNFLISEDGETWVSFHGGAEPGKSGNLFKLIALEQGYLTDEREPLRGEAFKQTIRYCRERWG